MPGVLIFHQRDKDYNMTILEGIQVCETCEIGLKFIF